MTNTELIYSSALRYAMAHSVHAILFMTKELVFATNGHLLSDKAISQIHQEIDDETRFMQVVADAQKEEDWQAIRDFSDDDKLYLFAFRYALGRRTYMPGVVCEEIKKVVDAGKLSDSCKTQMVEEIDGFKERVGKIGDPCDERIWMALKAFLEGQQVLVREDNQRRRRQKWLT